MTSEANRYRVELLDKHHNRAEFSSGVEPLDRYLRQQAGQDRRRGIAMPYVLTDTTTQLVLGYFTLSAFSIVPTGLPSEVTRRLPHYEAFPAILLGRLAVDQRQRGRGLGKVLVADALRRCLAISQQIGVMAVVVDAKSDDARAFYEHFGFMRFADHEYRLFMPITEISQLQPGVS